MKYLYSLAFLLLFSTKPGIAGSVDSGIAPYERCALCHGLFGNTSRTKFPKLAGQNEQYLEKQIADFLSGARSNDGGQMATVVTEIDTGDIAEIVSWFASQTVPEPYDTADGYGAELFASAGCSDCHVEQTGEDVAVPLLSAQHPEYLAKQMKDYRDGVRSESTDEQIHQALVTETDQNIESIARHLASVSRPQ
jgi:cytochrome c553